MIHLKQIILVAFQSIKFSVRNRIIPGMIILFLPILLGLHFLNYHNFAFQIKFLKDISLLFLTLFAGIILLYMASEQMFWFENGKVPYLVVTRMKSRFNLVVGIAFGITITVSLSLLLSAVSMLIFLKISNGIWFWELIPSVVLLSFQFFLMTSVLSFFSSFLPKSSALSLGILVYLIGNIHSSIAVSIGNSLGNSAAEFYRVISIVFPDFSIFDLREIMIHDYHISLPAFCSIILYSIFTSMFFLTISSIVVNQKDL